MGRISNSKERLLQVAFDLIWQQSYGSVSVDDICDRARVKKGSFYYFFPSKSDLAVAAYEEHWLQIRPKFDRVFSPQVSPLERLENYCMMIYEGQKEKKAKTGRVLGCPFASVGCEMSTQDEQMRSKTQEMFDRYCKYIETTLRDAANDHLVENSDFAGKAETVVAFIVGMMMRAKMKNDPEVLRGLYPTVLQFIGATTVTA